MDKLTPEQRHKNMQAVKNRDTQIERILRKELWKRGLHYRKNSNNVFGHPDIVFIGKKVAVFCDSEFWHGYNWEKRKNDIKSHQDFWLMQYKRIIKEIYPPFLLMENVPGIKSSFGGRILKEFIAELENEGSPDNECCFVLSNVVNAADYGVPQLRKRFVLHAVRCDILKQMEQLNLTLTLPIPTHSKTGKDNKQKWVTVREVFAGLPKIEAGERYSDDKIKNHYCANLSDKNIQRMRIIRENGGSRTVLPENLVLKCHTTYSGHTDVYGIMNPDVPAPTMTGGCLSYSKGRFGHPFENRAISVREAARIQTFPDDYIFGESLTKAALEIGNAVPIKLVKASGSVFINIIMQLNDNKK